jgi:HK97 family phage portal protein
MTPNDLTPPTAASPNNAPIAITLYGTTDIHGPTVVNEYAALSIPVVYSCYRYLTETLAGLPKRVMLEASGVRNEVKHKINKLIQRNINPLTTPVTFWETLYHHAISWGNGYAPIIRDQLGNATAIYNINPEYVTPFRFTDASSGEQSQWYCVAGAGKDKKGQVIGSADMIHISGLGFDGMQGYPILFLLAETFEYGRNIQRFATRYLKSGTQLQGTIELPANVSATQATIDQITDQIRRQHSGINAGYTHLILPQGATMQNNTINPRDSQLIEAGTANLLDFCRILRVSPQKVYELGRATWGNAETMALEDIKYSLRGWIIKGEQQLTSKLLTESEQDRGLFIEFDLTDLLRGEHVTMAAIATQLTVNGIQTPNEARASLNMPPITDDPTANQLRMPVLDAQQPVEAPKAAPLPSEKASGASEAPPQPKPRQSSSAALSVVIDDACRRVDLKTEKAFGNKATLEGEKRAIWVNLFAVEQSKYVREALDAVNAALMLLDGKGYDLQSVSESYATAIKRKASDGTAINLRAILDQSTEQVGAI